MNVAGRIALVVAGLIHLLPLPGVLGGDTLARLYGVVGLSPDLELLLRHRALLFGLLGGLLIAAVWRPDWQALAIVAGLISTLAFLLLVGDPRELAAPLLRVWWADVIAVLALLLAAWTRRRRPRRS